MSGDYYTFSSNELTAIESEIECNLHGKHLASVHSASKMDFLFATCQCDFCWIGLKTHRIDSENTTVFEWTDRTIIDSSFIEQNWCKSHSPIHDNRSHFISVDSYGKCLLSSTNSSFSACSICGPTMIDHTNGLYMISHVIIPFALSLFGLIYLLYHYVILSIVLRRKKTFENWILIPSKAITRTAIWTPPVMALLFVLVFIHSILFYNAYTKTGILAPTTWIGSQYPNIYGQIGAVKFFIVAMYHMVTVIVYVHLFLRLHHSFNHNPVFATKVPTKCECTTVIVLVILYAVIVLVYSVLHVLEVEDIPNMYAVDSLYVWHVGFIDIVMHSFLLYLYCESFRKFKEHFVKYTLQNVQSQHGILIELRRYTVLFSVVCVTNIITTMLVIAVMNIIAVMITMFQYEEESMYIYIGTMIIMILLYFKVMISFRCIYFSFNANSKQTPCNVIAKKRYKIVKHVSIPLKKGDARNAAETYDYACVAVQNNTYEVASNIHSNEANCVNDADQITMDDYLPTGEHAAESHPFIADMQNAEDNVDAINVDDKF